MKKFIVFTLTLIVFGCDFVHNDVDLRPTKTLQIATYNSKPTVVDLQNIFPGFTNVSLTNQTGINYFSSRYISYVPSPTTPSQFSFTVTKADNTKALVSAVAMGQASQSCADAPPFTYAKISNTETLSVNLFNNPEFCGFDISSSTSVGIAGPQTGIDVDQNSDGLNIAICACRPAGNTAVLTYVPPAGFTGQVKSTYYLGVGGYTTGSDLSQYYTPTGHTYFSKHDLVIDVTN